MLHCSVLGNRNSRNQIASFKEETKRFRGKLLLLMGYLNKIILCNLRKGQEGREGSDGRPFHRIEQLRMPYSVFPHSETSVSSRLRTEPRSGVPGGGQGKTMPQALGCGWVGGNAACPLPWRSGSLWEAASMGQFAPYWRGQPALCTNVGLL